VTTRLKHTDDDGDLSIFVSGDEVLFACNHGHAWTAQVSVHIHTCRLDHEERDHAEEDSPAEGPSPPTHGAA
jgi:hypothetical protein